MKGKDKMEEKKIDERYAAASHVPKRVLKTIDVGRLKGKSDINPQWKISLMTEIYGMCGIGWKFEVTEKNTVTINTGEVMLFMTVAVYIKNDEKWSDPVYGMGGDFIVKKERTGLHANDEAYKMCLTDALGNALKYIGVAADVYEQLNDTKYAERPSAIANDKEEKETTPADIRNDYLMQYIDVFRRANIDPNDFVKRFSGGRVTDVKDMPNEELLRVINNPMGAVNWYEEHRR
jgi:hypothetical protein